MLTPKQMRILDRAAADLRRADLAELLAQIRATRRAEFHEHVRDVIFRMGESREIRRARINEIFTEVRESKQEWQRQRRAIARARTDCYGKSHRHRPGNHE